MDTFSEILISNHGFQQSQGKKHRFLDERLHAGEQTNYDAKKGNLLKFVLLRNN